MLGLTAYIYQDCSTQKSSQADKRECASVHLCGIKQLWSEHRGMVHVQAREQQVHSSFLPCQALGSVARLIASHACSSASRLRFFLSCHSKMQAAGEKFSTDSASVAVIDKAEAASTESRSVPRIRLHPLQHAEIPFALDVGHGQGCCNEQQLVRCGAACTHEMIAQSNSREVSRTQCTPMIQDIGFEQLVLLDRPVGIREQWVAHVCLPTK
jgi:hypothetical protein